MPADTKTLSVKLPSLDVFNTEASVPVSSLLLGPVGPPWTGMETATAGLRGALRELGPVSLVNTSISKSNNDKGRVSAHKVRALIGMMRDLRQRRADVSHVPISQNVPGLVRDLAMLACLSKPIVGYLHGGAYAAIIRDGGLRSWLLRRVLRRVSGIACLYEAQCDELREVGISRPMAAIGNAIADSWSVARASGQRHDPLRVLYLGLISRAKGFDVLCAAVDGLQGVSVTAVGDWHSHDRNLKLGDLPSDFTLPVNVSVCEPIDHSAIPRLLTEHDVLVLPSHSEGLPMTVLEAMSIGVPVIASRVGALRELADDDHLTPLDAIDPDQLRQRLLEVSASYDHAIERARTAREFVRRRYSHETIACRIQGLLRQLGDA